MKQTTNYQRSVQFLNKVFQYANIDMFNNELPTPVITIQSSPKSYGHFVADSKAWTIDNGDGTKRGAYEINISAGTLNRPIENIVSTMIHEMVHLYCHINGLHHVSSHRQYHTKVFKAEAEKRGLSISNGGYIGWSVTEPTERILDFCIEHQLEDIRINRTEYNMLSFIGGGAKSGGNVPTGTTKKGNSFKWICPCCNATVRSTKPTVNILCGDCGVAFVRA